MLVDLIIAIKPLEIFVDDETKLTLHGLQQFYVKLEEAAKNRKLNDLLDNLEFNQARATFRCGALLSTKHDVNRSLSSSNPLLVPMS